MNTEPTNQQELTRAKVDAARMYLNDVKQLETKLRFAQVEYQMALERASGLTGIDYSRDTVTTSPSADAIPNAVERYTELKEQLDAMALIVEDAVSERDELVWSLDSNEGSVVRMRYVQGCTVPDVAYALGYSPDHIKRLQREGLVELYDAGLPVEYRINYQQAI